MIPTVSVNITTYNRSDLLPRCLESVFQQTFQNIELNVINDASEDSTADLLEYWAKNKPIRVFTNEKRHGNAASRNRLFRESTGALIAFLDDDDYWVDCNKLSKQVDKILKHGTSAPIICCTGVSFETLAGIEKQRLNMPKNIKTAILKGNGFIYNSTVLTTRKTLELTNGFDEKMPRGVDSEFFRSAIITHHATLEFVPVDTTVCRVHGKRITTSISTIEDRKKHITAHARIIRKYTRNYLTHPLSLIQRLQKMFTAVMKR